LLDLGQTILQQINIVRHSLFTAPVLLLGGLLPNHYGTSV
jgi:hypothetical protein